jgi:hypothetical protein
VPRYVWTRSVCAILTLEVGGVDCEDCFDAVRDEEGDDVDVTDVFTDVVVSI